MKVKPGEEKKAMKSRRKMRYLNKISTRHSQVDFWKRKQMLSSVQNSLKLDYSSPKSLNSSF